MKIIYPRIIIEGEKGAHGLDFTVLLYISWTKSFEKEKMITFPSECATPLGMEKKVIPDYAITASTEVRATEKKLLLQIEDSPFPFANDIYIAVMGRNHNFKNRTYLMAVLNEC